MSFKFQTVMFLDVSNSSLAATNYTKDQLIQLTPEIRRLREYKNNSLLSVSKLPVEILLMIFGHLAFPSLSYRRVNFYVDLLPATQVCRRWRQVALDSPRLWRTIDASAPLPLAKLFLERASSGPLSLLGDSTSKDGTVSAVLDRLSQVANVSLMKCKSQWLERIISEPALRLESLLLQNALPHTVHAFQFPAGACPALQHLSLIRYVCNPRISSLTALTSLFIDCAGVTNRAQLPDVTGLLAMLKNHPRLSYVTLIDALAPLNGPSPPIPTSGPNIINWIIEENDIRNLARMLHVARFTTKSVTLWYTTSSQDMSEIASFFIICFYKSVLNSYSSFCFAFELNTCRIRPHAGVKFTPGHNVNSRKPINAPAFFELRVSSSTRNLRPELSIFKLFPSTTAHPHTLYFTSDVTSFQDDPLATARRDLRELTNITELHAKRLIDLALILCDTPANRGQPMSLPSLKKIVLHRAWSEGYKRGVLSRLNKQLKARRELGAEIETSGW